MDGRTSVWDSVPPPSPKLLRRWQHGAAHRSESLNSLFSKSTTETGGLCVYRVERDKKQKKKKTTLCEQITAKPEAFKAAWLSAGYPFKLCSSTPSGFIGQQRRITVRARQCQRKWQESLLTAAQSAQYQKK